jgi:pimeloyl-ACP methyl ester carboxylesterase
MNYSMRWIAFFVFLMANGIYSFSQDIPYGNNPAAGNYVNVGDAKIYYEVYGKGKPLIMLHGGVYGWIDEFAPFIQKFSTQFQVICIGTRGHGKSEIGKEPFSYDQRANDAYKVIRTITRDSVIVVGFSDGGFSAFKLAAKHPELVKKLITIGVGDYSPGQRNFNYNRKDLMNYDSSFFKQRLSLMPEPARWDEALAMLTKMYNESIISKETFEKIKCPVLLMNGEKDDYFTVESVKKCAGMIRNARLSIIPDCTHVVFFCNFEAVWASVKPFLSIK